MKLSDLLTGLAENARVFETRARKWQDEMEAKGEELMASARRWQESAKARQEDLDKQIQGYLADASENVRTPWAELEGGWDEQVARTRAKAEELRAKAETMQAEDYADWSEAYAATVVSYAQQMQDQASTAVAAATEARAKADALKNGV